jgi:hypothetical protein
MTEKDLEIHEKSKTSWHEEQYGSIAMEIAHSQGIFAQEDSQWQFESREVSVVVRGDLAKLDHWKSQMLQDAANQDALRTAEKEVSHAVDNVQIFNDMQSQSDTTADVEMIRDPEPYVHETLLLVAQPKASV